MKGFLACCLIAFAVTANAFPLKESGTSQIKLGDEGFSNKVKGEDGQFICSFMVEFTVPKSIFGWTLELQKQVTDLVDHDVKGIPGCTPPNHVSTYCFSYAVDGVIVQGCAADLGFHCSVKESVWASCFDVDVTDLIGKEIPVKDMTATCTKVIVRDDSYSLNDLMHLIRAKKP